MRNKNYFIIVHKTTNAMLLEDGKLPIYWMKNVATERASGFKEYIVKPILADLVKQLIPDNWKAVPVKLIKKKTKLLKP